MQWKIDLQQYLRKTVFKNKKENVFSAETFWRNKKKILKTQENSKPDKKIEVLQKPKRQKFTLGLNCLFHKLKGRDKENSRKEETSYSSEQNANCKQLVGQKSQPLRKQKNHGYGGGGGDDPNKQNKTKKLPVDANLFDG